MGTRTRAESSSWCNNPHHMQGRVVLWGWKDIGWYVTWWDWNHRAILLIVHRALLCFPWKYVSLRLSKRRADRCLTTNANCKDFQNKTFHRRNIEIIYFIKTIPLPFFLAVKFSGQFLFCILLFSCFKNRNWLVWKITGLGESKHSCPLNRHVCCRQLEVQKSRRTG